MPRDDETELVGWLDSQELTMSALRKLEEEQVREEGRPGGYVPSVTGVRERSWLSRRRGRVVQRIHRPTGRPRR